jgi:hypothetical protein
VGWIGTYHDDVAVQILTDVNVTLHDGVESGDMDTTAFETQNARLEEGFRSTETLVTDGDDLTIRKFVRLLKTGALRSSLDLLLEVEGDVAELLLDVTDNFTLSGRREGVTTFSENLHQVVGQVTTSHVDTRDGVRKSKPFVDGYHVGDTITGIEHNTSGATGGIEGQDSLNGDVEGRCVEGLENDLSHLLSVGLGIDGSFCQQNRVLLRSDTQLVVEGVMPDLLHVIPVGDHAVLNGVTQSEDTTLRLGLIANIGVLLAHTNHDTTFLRLAPDGFSCDTGMTVGAAVAIWIEEEAPTHGGEDDQQLRLFEQSVRVQKYRENKPRDQERAMQGEWDYRNTAGARRVRIVGLNLRNTARGASSPAKPALHIPELSRTRVSTLKLPLSPL